MKKILIFAICFLVISTPIYANSAVTVSVETVTAELGQEVEANILISENSKMTGGNLILAYDNEILELISVAQNETMNSYSCFINDRYDKNKIKISWAGTSPLSLGGSLFILRFKTVNESVNSENVIIEKLKLADSTGNKIDTTVKNGMVNVFSDNLNKPTSRPSSGSAGLRPSKNNGDEQNDEVLNEVLPFSDVKETDWYYEAVKFAFEKGITSGVSETSYAPNDKVTRGQFITMLCRAYGIKEMTGDNFADCGDTWYTGYLAAAKQHGISNGVGDNKFAPEKEITREEMVTLIYNYLKSVGKVDEEINKTTFTDDDIISDWAKNGVAFANYKGYVNGKGDNLFDPNGDATRAELAQIFFNMFK